MIDLAEMTAIAVDPKRGRVTAGGGANWDELNAATGEHGLAVTGGAISTTGIAGLTLGGGLGWLMGSTGSRPTTWSAPSSSRPPARWSASTRPREPDLLWALRGGGGNFGVVTAFTYRLHPVATITGGLIAHPIDAAPDVLRFYRDAAAGDVRRPDRVRGARPRAGRLGRQARRDGRLPPRRRRRPRERELAPFTRRSARRWWWRSARCPTRS